VRICQIIGCKRCRSDYTVNIDYKGAQLRPIFQNISLSFLREDDSIYEGGPCAEVEYKLVAVCAAPASHDTDLLLYLSSQGPSQCFFSIIIKGPTGKNFF
jgi:hypothetical protein